MTETPVIIANIQRGGPSTGLPTKTEQADLFQAVFGRNGECPVPVVSACTPGDCFYTAIEAVRIATRYMTPVIFLSDGYLANGAEPWLIPKVEDIAPFPVRFRTDPEGFLPYKRDERGARDWVLPGTVGMEHRIGGLEKEDLTGHVSYNPKNHEKMVKLRAAKVAGIADELPPLEVFGAPAGDVLVLGWGSTFGSIRAAVDQAVSEGRAVGHVHLRHLFPFPKDLHQILQRYKKVLVPELNLGQLAFLIRGTYLTPTEQLNKVQGLPFTVREVLDAIRALVPHTRPMEVSA
jgi:2-oxoglutarate ferredoxin oxidoreductase subunit alpha